VICYENRNGLVLAYDVEARRVVVPGGEDVPVSGLDPLAEFDPESIREELDSRGVQSVRVYIGDLPSWVDGQIVGSLDRARKFVAMASQSGRSTRVWAEIPIARLTDGTEWSDIYG
jgi:hypothetical protein